MLTRNCRLNGAVVGVLAMMGLGFGVMPGQTKASTLWYDANGTTGGYGISTNGGTYNWDTTRWANASNGTTATAAWVQGDGADFLGAPGTGASYTVPVANDEQITGSAGTSGASGLELGTTTTSVTMTVSQSGSGQLDVGANVVGFRIGTSSNTLKVTAPIVGTGGQVVQHGNGALALYGANTFSGGMEVTGGQVTDYNSSQSFGTGAIIIGGNGEALVNGGSSGITIPNNFSFLNPNYALNLAAGPGTIAGPNTIFSGNFPLPATGTTNIETSNSNTTYLQISGKISGGNVEFSDQGNIILTGPNTYTGTTLISSAVNGPVTVILGASGTIGSSSQVIMSGGILNPDGLDQDMSANTTIALAGTASLTSTIDFGAGNAEMDFKDSHGVAWTSGDILNLKHWSFSFDAMRFGTSSSGLTAAQLSEIEFNGDATTLGTAYLNASGYLVPEPASTMLLLLGAPLLAARRRRG